MMTCASLRFAGDRIAQFTVRQDAAEVSSYRLVGTRGDLRVEPAFDYAVPLVHHLTIEGETQTREFPARDQFAAEISYFSRCIQEGTEPEPDGGEGLADVRIMTAIQKSARSGRPVTLPPFERTRRPDMGQNIEKPPMILPEPIESPSPVVH
jgi:predicted dehydrogenase